jgi:hypothetical protein
LPRICVTAARSDDTRTWPTLISFDQTKLSKCALSQLWWPHSDIYLCVPLHWPRAHSCCRHTALWNSSLFQLRIFRRGLQRLAEDEVMPPAQTKPVDFILVETKE